VLPIWNCRKSTQRPQASWTAFVARFVLARLAGKRTSPQASRWCNACMPICRSGVRLRSPRRRSNSRRIRDCQVEWVFPATVWAIGWYCGAGFH
jgi:hypothetical protein